MKSSYRIDGILLAILMVALTALAAMGCASSPASAGKYADGTYQIESEGFGGPLVLRLLIVKGAIREIVVVSHNDTEAYADPVFDEYIRRVLKEQRPDVDAVGGASFSEASIRKALSQALSKATR